MTGQTVVLTGASGFVAKHILVCLLRDGWRVRASLRDAARADEVRAAVMPHLPAGNERALSFVTLDMTRDEGWDAALEDADALVHTASPFPVVPPDDPEILIRPAVGGTLRALRAAHRSGVGRAIVTSSIVAIVGAPLPSGRDAYDEGDWSDPDPAVSGAYAASKTQAERAAWNFVRDEAPGMALTVINPAMVAGPPLDAHYGDSIALIERLWKGGDPMMPRTGLPFADVRDVAEAHVRALQRPETAGERIIVSAGSLWYAEVGRAIRDASPNSRAATWTAPDALIRFLARFSPTIRAAVPGLGKLDRLSNDRVRSLLGMDFIPAAEAVGATARWLDAHRR